ncbi:MAG: fructose-bisphosphate aldolase class I [Candidatus Marinimicrobia bacterium]|jgi:fructose-bisphosphate aldolase class I|nr:fructose-bisphosphate aldolase class I [Candidatus Neomarinimicrobiota bacterium]MDP6456757.1 fructose-bisphosphate aldolase class I [Candidatus Neomarinimicrobiota bacterium]MDP6593803.1 fructose-bisphosphate aldolase class I [Candidatus Neomarinimicrobiota bacterium]MDP6837147.1 fructose-bisphosphate aldolase class I [Candidatus Neomarinimicrobiota bacterium]MDP6966832.1 fructose-bisphosphate aldolase class I [Candidatus Neomarinimicrobiota bacterium]|tara:strand:+ start:668 stop:1705 length:1038 start_codon:yes stop_codon:yes gene_type:complete
MNLEQLESTAKAMVVPGKGILAADESTPTIKKRFDQINVKSTEERRRYYRNMLFTAEVMENHISGVIMFDETLRQSSLDGEVPFPKFLADIGVIPGIKVDEGAKPLAGYEDEKVTEGLDGLRDRLAEYYDLGARFAKWRAVITIREDAPSFACIDANAHALARYAALCQEADIVPIVEPEVLMDGEHNIEASFEVTAEVLNALFEALFRMDVYLEGTILKPNMVLSGYDCSEQASVDEVAEATVSCFQRFVPAAVPGVCFLSGGQSDLLATQHLNAMNTIDDLVKPWQLSFSYGRALQQSALKAWGGDDSNAEAAQKAFYHRAKCNGAATLGQYSDKMEKEGAPA